MEHTNINPSASIAIGVPADIAVVIAANVIEAAMLILDDPEFQARLTDLPCKLTREEYDTLNAADMIDGLNESSTTTEVIAAVVDRADLAKAVAACTRVVEKRSTIPVLCNLLLQGDGDKLAVRGTDLDVEMAFPVTGKADPRFATTLPAHKLHDLLRKAKACETVMLNVTRKRTVGRVCRFTGHWEGGSGYSIQPIDDTEESVSLALGQLKVGLHGLPPADFPKMESGPYSHSFTLATSDFARGLERTEFAISAEETRYYLNGVYLHANDKLHFVATDGHRLAKVDMTAPKGAGIAMEECPYTGDMIETAAPMPGVIIPRKTVGELLKLCTAKGAPADVSIRVNEKRIEVTVGDAVVTSKTIDGTFPDYHRVIPTGNDKRLLIDRDKMADAIKQVTVLSNERGRAVKLTMDKDSVTFTVSDPDTGSANLTIDADYGSDAMEIGFNAYYLLDCLEQCTTDTVEFMLADAGSPTLIRDKNDGDVTYVLMPMRV